MHIGHWAANLWTRRKIAFWIGPRTTALSKHGDESVFVFPTFSHLFGASFQFNGD